MKYIKKLLSVIMAMTILLSMSAIPTYAKEEFTSPEDVLEIQTETELLSFYESIQNMNEDELQDTILYVQTATENRSVVNKVALKAAWLAAAQIAKQKGYPLSAKLVEHSVINKDYSETNGAFAKTIKKTSLWKNMKNKKSGSVEFTKSINSDLFYSIHKCSYTTSSNRVTVKDVFDFKLETNYKSLFTTLVNNWAFLNQNISVLHKIDVKIGIDK